MKHTKYAKWNVHIVIQLGLSPETSKKNLTTKDENILIEEIFKYEVTLYGQMKGSERGGDIVKRKMSIWKTIAATLSVGSYSKMRN